VQGAELDALVRAIIDRSELGILIRQLQAMLDGKVVRAGRATLVWPGGASESNVLTVTHGVPNAPFVQVSPVSRVGGVEIVAWTATPGDTTFDLRGSTIDASNPAAAATATVDWLAVG
jgi:hypothetical protein